MVKLICINKKIQKMLKHHNNSKSKYLTPLILTSLLTVGSVFAASPVFADVFDDQIATLRADIEQKNDNIGGLKDSADDLQAKIDDYVTKIAALQAQIDSNNVKMDDLNQQITKAKADLAKQKKVLAAVLRSVYFGQSQTPLETLVSSNSLSEYFDEQDNQQRLGQQVNTTIGKIGDLQRKLTAQKEIVGLLLEQQQQNKTELASAKAQVDSSLANNKSAQSKFAREVKISQKKIAELQAQQAIQAQQAAGNLSSIGGIVVSGSNGGYPAKWADAVQDSLVDDWGMYNRECVSYTAFKVWQSGKHMPYWGGRGNANQWPSSARTDGIPVDGNPKVGDVAISMAGDYGHAMYVEKVYGDGTIYVSQYNYGSPGTYSEMRINSAGLYFIHFK